MHMQAGPRLTKWRKKQIKYERDWRHMLLPTTHDDAKDVLLSVVHAVQAYLGGGEG